jgi:hypothetical protein
MWECATHTHDANPGYYFYYYFSTSYRNWYFICFMKNEVIILLMVSVHGDACALNTWWKFLYYLTLHYFNVQTRRYKISSEFCIFGFSFYGKSPIHLWKLLLWICEHTRVFLAFSIGPLTQLDLWNCICDNYVFIEVSHQHWAFNKMSRNFQ